ncbi:hypothetical protein KI387_025430, partial [Taxus chinensis]
MALGSLGTCETRMRETRGSAESGEKVTTSPKFLGHLGRKSVKYVVRVFRPKKEQLTQFDLGHLGCKCVKYAIWANRPKMQQLVKLTLGHLGHESA